MQGEHSRNWKQFSTAFKKHRLLKAWKIVSIHPQMEEQDSGWQASRQERTGYEMPSLSWVGKVSCVPSMYRINLSKKIITQTRGKEKIPHSLLIISTGLISPFPSVAVTRSSSFLHASSYEWLQNAISVSLMKHSLPLPPCIYLFLFLIVFLLVNCFLFQ